jgi:hypothetical protein
MPRLVTLSQTAQLASVGYRITIIDTAAPITGSLTVFTGDQNRRRVEARFGCRLRPAESEHAWQCTVPFRRVAPDWAAVLRQLDRAGVMAPPTDLRLAPIIICNDGVTWDLTVQSPPGSVVVRDEQECGSTSSRRDAYEEEVEAVLASVVAFADAA